MSFAMLNAIVVLSIIEAIKYTVWHLLSFCRFSQTFLLQILIHLVAGFGLLFLTHKQAFLKIPMGKIFGKNTSETKTVEKVGGPRCTLYYTFKQSSLYDFRAM